MTHPTPLTLDYLQHALAAFSEPVAPISERNFAYQWELIRLAIDGVRMRDCAREAVEATKISLLVLTTFEERMKDLLHSNMLKDLRFAIEANRHARRELLAVLDPAPNGGTSP